MSSTTPRRFYIDHDAAREEAIIRRVLVTPQRQQGTTPRPTTHGTKNAATLLGNLPVAGALIIFYSVYHVLGVLSGAERPTPEFDENAEAI